MKMTVFLHFGLNYLQKHLEPQTERHLSITRFSYSHCIYTTCQTDLLLANCTE